MPCSRSPEGGGSIPACLVDFRPTPKGEVEGGLARGSPGPHPRGKLRGIRPGGVSRPTPTGDQAGGVPAPGGACSGGVCRECILVNLVSMVQRMGTQELVHHILLYKIFDVST